MEGTTTDGKVSAKVQFGLAQKKLKYLLRFIPNMHFGWYQGKKLRK